MNKKKLSDSYKKKLDEIDSLKSDKMYKAPGKFNVGWEPQGVKSDRTLEDVAKRAAKRASANSKFLQEAKALSSNWQDATMDVGHVYAPYASTGKVPHPNQTPQPSIGAVPHHYGRAPIEIKTSTSWDGSKWLSSAELGLTPDGKKFCRGIVCFYVRDVNSESVTEYLDSVEESLAEGFYPVRFRLAGKRMSHVEVWPLAAESQELLLYIQRNKRMSKNTDDSLYKFAREFDKQHSEFLTSLYEQGVKFKIDYGTQTKLVLY